MFQTQTADAFNHFGLSPKVEVQKIFDSGRDAFQEFMKSFDFDAIPSRVSTKQPETFKSKFLKSMPVVEAAKVNIDPKQFKSRFKL